VGDRTEGHEPAGVADGETASVDRRVAESKARTHRLRARIEARRQAAPVNGEAEFLAREATKAGVSAPLDRPATATPDRRAATASEQPAAPTSERAATTTLEQLLTRLAAGEIDVDEAMALEVVDDA
jgi:hypothetical protein